MTIRIWVLVLTLVIFLDVTAQRSKRNEESNVVGHVKTKLETGDVFKLKKNALIETIFPSSEGGYWSLTGAGGVQYVQNFDAGLNLVKNKKLSLRYEGKFLELFRVHKVGQDYYAFLTSLDREKGKLFLYYVLFNPLLLNIDGDIIKISEAKYRGKGYTFPSFTLTVSDNKDHIIVYAEDAQKVKSSGKKGFFSSLFASRASELKSSSVGNRKFNFTYWVFDNKMKPVNYQEKLSIEIQNSADKFYVREFKIDKQGNVFILGKNELLDEISKNEQRMKKIEAWAEYKKSAFVVQKIAPDGSQTQYVTHDDVLYLDMKMLFDKEDNIQLVGLSGEPYFDGLLATGVARITLDAKLNELSLSTDEFTPEVLSKVNPIQEFEERVVGREKKKYDRKKERKENKMTAQQKEYSDLAKRAALDVSTIEYVGIDEGGNAQLVLEEQYMRVVTTTTRNPDGTVNTTTDYYYHYNDLIFCKFHEDRVLQNYYKKNFVSVNFKLPESLNATINSNNDMLIITQEHLLVVDQDLEVRAGEIDLKLINRMTGRKKFIITKRMITEDNEIVLVAKRLKKTRLIKIGLERRQ